MNIHIIRHVDFENEGAVRQWAQERGHKIKRTMLQKGESLPDPDSPDCLFVMGGPMNVYEEMEYPFLKNEKRFLKELVRRKTRVIGICLGAQLLADVLGAKVIKNREKEIGWFDVGLMEEAKKTRLMEGIPARFKAFHWHGDAFTIPAGAVRLAKSEACLNQAFIYDDHILALQFHLEAEREGVSKLVKNCGNELKAGKYIQSPEMISDDKVDYAALHTILYRLLDNF